MGLRFPLPQTHRPSESSSQGGDAGTGPRPVACGDTRGLRGHPDVPQRPLLPLQPCRGVLGDPLGTTGCRGWPRPPRSDGRGFRALGRKLNPVSLSNTGGESALVYPRDLWSSPGARRDVHNSAVLLVGVGGPLGSSALQPDGPPQGSPSAPPGTLHPSCHGAGCVGSGAEGARLHRWR